jgi:hypothetical protein
LGTSDEPLLDSVVLFCVEVVAVVVVVVVVVVVGGRRTTGCGGGSETCGWLASPSKAGWPAMSGGGGEGESRRRIGSTTG